MKYTVSALAALALLLGVGFAIKTAHPKSAISTVLVSDVSGHGSGVHIGHGYIVTAAHVVEDNPTVQITDSLGHKHTGTVLWSNKVYDIALVRIGDYSDVGSARLTCSHSIPVGTNVSAVGNPLSLENITTWGKISSDIRERGPWKLSVVADMTIAPGMSGGPVFDAVGEVVGIVVGVAIMPNDMGIVAPFAVSYVVPSEAVCALMGRT
jgi:S1-C subfamily serine protease